MPGWLPDKLEIDPWTTETYDFLYMIFCQDIRDYDLFYTVNIVLTPRTIKDGKEELFWHLTTREQKPEKIPRRKQKFKQNNLTNSIERKPDFRRCKRLSWVMPLIENSTSAEVLAWDYQEGNGAIKTYIWLKTHDFVVILKKFSNGNRLLITSFFVEEYKRKDFDRKYKNRLT